MFFWTADILAGLAGLALASVTKFRRNRGLCLGGLLFFIVVGFVLGWITLTDYYDHPTGTVQEWFFSTCMACLAGVVPAAVLFSLGWMRNRSKLHPDAIAESRSSAS